MGKDRYANLIECSGPPGIKAYLAHDTVLDREVELKVFPWAGDAFGGGDDAAQEGPDPKRSEYFREARAVSLLEHPSVPAVLDAGDWGEGSYYYALRLARGEILGNALAREESRAGRMRYLPQFTVACRALAYAHTRGVIHRRLTPASIVMGPYGDVFVEGWSRAHVRNGSSSGVVDAEGDDEHAEFRSPEIRRGAAGDARSDVYSLGAILYLMLTGQTPPPNIDSVPATQLSDALGIICRRAMAGSPESRYESVDDLLADLSPIGGNAGGHETAVMERVRRRATVRRKKWLRNGAGIAALLAVLAFAAIRFWPSGSEWAVDTQTIGNGSNASGDLADAAIANGLNARRPLATAHMQLRAWADIHSAAGFFADGNIPAAAAALERVPSPERRWEWGYLHRAMHRDRVTIDASDTPIFALAIAPDGKTVTSAGQDRLLREWNLETGAAAGTREGHLAELRTVAISPDGKLMVSGGWDRKVVVWNRETGQPSVRYEGHDDVIWAARFAPDGSWIASAGDDGTIHAWDPLNGQPVDRLFQLDTKDTASMMRDSRARAWALSFSDDGRYLAKGDIEGVLSIFDLEARNLVRTIETGEGLVTGLDARSGTHELWATFYSGQVRVYSMRNGEELDRLHAGSDAIWAVALSPDGQYAVTAGRSNRAIIWNAAARSPIARVDGHASEIFAAAFGPDNDLIVTADHGGQIKLWRVSDFVDSTETSLNLGAKLLPFTRRVALTSQNRDIDAIAINPAGTVAATGGSGERVTLWDLRDGAEIDALWSRGRGVTAAEFSADGNSLAIGWRRGAVDVWDVSTRSIKRHLRSRSDGVDGLAFSDDGTYLAIGKRDGQVMVWNLESNAQEFRFAADTSAAAALAFHPFQQRLVTGGQSGLVRVWEDQDAAGPILELEGHDARILDVAFSPGGRYLVSASFAPAIYLWDFDTGTQAQRINAHTSSVRCLDFSADGTRILSAGDDASVRLWDVVNGRSSISFDTAGSAVATARFTDGDAAIVAGTRDGMVYIWEGATENAPNAGNVPLAVNEQIELRNPSGE